MNVDILFSVVIPTYNRKDKLLRGLKSLNAQTYRDFEVIVCDDGSTDETEKMIDLQRPLIRFRKLRYVFGQNWGGPARPRNVGISKAAGRWICFLDSDDLWHPEKLEQLLPHLNDHDFLYHSFDMVSGGELTRPLLSRNFKIPVFEDLMLKGHNGSIITSGVCVKKELVEDAGGFSEDKSLIGVEDADLWLKIARITNKFKYIPARLGTYYQEGENLTIYNQQMIDRLQALFRTHAYWLGGDRLKSLAEKTNNYHLARITQKMGNSIRAKQLFQSSMGSPNMQIVLRSVFWIIYLKLKKANSQSSRINRLA